MKPMTAVLRAGMCALALLLCAQMRMQAQSPTIAPTQYVLQFYNSYPADVNTSNYRNNTSVNNSAYGPGATLLGSFGAQGSMTITETNRPTYVNVTHSRSIQYLNCQDYSGNPCNPGGGGGGGGIGIEARANTGGDRGRDPQGAAAGSPTTPSLPPAGDGSCYCNWGTPYTYAAFSVSNLQLTYPEMDTTVYAYAGSQEKVRVVLYKSTDDNLNLPSHDEINIKATGNVSGYKWQYQVFENTSSPWVDVNTSYVLPGGNEIRVSGQSLFGANVFSQINKTIIFRLAQPVGAGFVTSNILVYTHRLSSPIIMNTTTINNNCYRQDSGSVKITFSRPLYWGETINIFLKDTLNGLDYSALNITDAQMVNQEYTWPKQLLAGKYKMSLIGKYNGYATYTGNRYHFKYITITEPTEIRHFLFQTPALCFDGNSGRMTIAAQGGVGNYKYELQPVDSAFKQVWTNFAPKATYNASTNGWELKHDGLMAGTYKVRVRDGNNCAQRDVNGLEYHKFLPVTQPQTALHLPLLTTSPITAHNVTDGRITARVAGGTPFVSNPELTQLKYRFEWRDSITNALITNYTLDTTGGKFETGLQNLAEGTYRLRVWDANYETALNTNRQGCLVDVFIPLKKPLPMNVQVVTRLPIKCNGDENGSLLAKASGGIPVSDSVKYIFTWYKQQQFTNNWLAIDIDDSIISNLSSGNYYVEIIDKNGYVKASAIYNLQNPPLLNAVMSSTPSTCFFSWNGSMSAAPNGGTAPYKYEWSNGAQTPTVTGVPGGNYVLVLKDSFQCQTVKQVVVTSPNKINTVVSTTPVGCNNSNTAALSLSATGGTGVFTYLWNTNATTSSINNIGAGTYWYKITDANGCYDTDTLTLENPEAYTMTAGPDRKLCIGQTIVLTADVSPTATPLTTVWTGPQGTVNNTQINVTTAGTYIATTSNGSGCAKKDTVVVVPENFTVNTSFTVSTQAFAGENVTLVNISPLVQDSAHWILPANSGITRISSSKQYCELKFSDTGRYIVGIRAFYANGCIDEKYKEVHITSRQSFTGLGNQAEAFLKEFGLYPNPNTGQFTLSMLFNSVTQARVRIINVLTNAKVSDRYLQGSASYSEQYNIGGVPAGTYMVVIETAKGSYIHKLNKL